MSNKFFLQPPIFAAGFHFNKATTTIFFMLCISMSGLKSQDSFLSDSVDVTSTINLFHYGFVQNDKKMIKSVLSDDLMYFNGNYSDDLATWQVHNYLSGKDLKNWLDFMLKEAGPFENNLRVIHCYIRRNAAILVTTETGRNKFRNWKDDKVVYLLGKQKGKWKLKSVFFKDAANPK